MVKFRKFFCTVLMCLVLLCFLLPKSGYAIYNPLGTPNNFIGIHILFPEELAGAAKLVNAKGDWGYVTIPIQAGDMDLVKWQLFMDECSRLHIIPIIRLATQSYWKDTRVWTKPNDEDIIDFANFLNSLTWPTQNRYVILFNEVNRYDEWGGQPPNPIEYTQLVDFAVDAFKARNPDFYVILAGLDNSSPDDGIQYLSNFDYLAQMANFNNQIFNRIDGFASHSYPNPGFSAPPSLTRRMGVATYRFEYDYINGFTTVKKPAFITETGWNSDKLSEETISTYFTYTLDKIWGEDKDKIVAITPFLLDGEDSGFNKFSFIQNGSVRKFYTTLQMYPKFMGKPMGIVADPTPAPSVTPRVLGVETFKTINDTSSAKNTFISFAKTLAKDLLGIR